MASDFYRTLSPRGAGHCWDWEPQGSVAYVVLNTENRYRISSSTSAGCATVWVTSEGDRAMKRGRASQNTRQREKNRTETRAKSGSKTGSA